MKFNSAICTSRKQSERLLALGLKKDTADCFHWNAYGRSYIGNIDDEKLGPDDVPAWSLHRLIEIAQLPQSWQCLSGDWYNEVIAEIQSKIHIGELNKEYLERI